MKLAVFVDHFPVASQTFVLNQVTGLIDLGVDVTVLSLHHGDAVLTEYPQLSQYQLHTRTVYLNPAAMESSLRITRMLSRLQHTLTGLLHSQTRGRTLKALNVRRYGHHGKSLLLASVAAQVPEPLHFDVILCHFGFNGVLADKLKVLGVFEGQIATIFHGYEISASAALQTYLQDYQQLFTRAALMLPVNALWQQKLLQLGCQAAKIQVQRMGVDLSMFEYQAKGDIGPTLRLFSVARFTEKKGLEYGLRALALLPDDIEFHYALAGYGELAGSLEQLVTELNLDNQVTFLGPLDQSQVIEQMQIADIFLQPSITADNGDMEGVPVAIMEAMAMGAVVVSTLHSGIPELIIHGEHGLLSPERDVTGLRDSISLLQRDLSLYNDIRLKARKRVEQMANVHELNQQLLESLKKLVPVGA